MQRVRPDISVKNAPAVGIKPIYVRPIWLSNWAYFGTSALVSLILFLTIWDILAHEGETGDSGWFPALLAGVVLFGVLATLHGVLLRRMKNKYLLQREEKKFPSSNGKIKDGKLTLEKHAAHLKKIQKKSEAADTANPLTPEAHLEVYRACKDYLEQIEAQLPTVHAGSPRIAAFRSGQERVRGLQKHHLLAWAGEESRVLLREAQIRVATSEKVETAQRALEVLEAGLQIYPNETQLTESAIAIQEFITASYVAHWVELAERAAFKENYEQAIDHYRDALFYLSRESVNETSKRETYIQIENEINRLQLLMNQGQGNKKILTQHHDADLEAEN